MTVKKVLEMYKGQYAEDNIAYFMRENLLAKSEENEVRRLYVKFDN